MENHQDNLWSLSAQKYFRLIEPEIIKKNLNGILPVRANKPFAFGAFISSYSISAMPRLSSRTSEPTSLYDSYYFPCKTLSTLPDFLSISI